MKKNKHIHLVNTKVTDVPKLAREPEPSGCSKSDQCYIDFDHSCGDYDNCIIDF